MGKIFLAIILFGMLVPADAQEKAPRPPTASQSTESVLEPLPEDFLQLADLRAKTRSDIDNLLRQIKDLQELLGTVGDLEAQIAELQNEINNLDKNTKRSEAQNVSLKFMEARLKELQKELKQKGTSEVLLQRTAEFRQQLKVKTALAAEIQKKFTEYLSPDHEFKKIMSLVFAVLIGAVIIGFFVIAYKDQEIRVAIFSGEAGIQFVTLFSLVIAIILFGITRILEGKELAALLGGLSGYILGRTSSRGSS